MNYFWILENVERRGMLPLSSHRCFVHFDIENICVTLCICFNEIKAMMCIEQLVMIEYICHNTIFFEMLDNFSQVISSIHIYESLYNLTDFIWNIFIEREKAIYYSGWWKECVVHAGCLDWYSSCPAWNHAGLCLTYNNDYRQNVNSMCPFSCHECGENELILASKYLTCLWSRLRMWRKFKHPIFSSVI